MKFFRISQFIVEMNRIAAVPRGFLLITLILSLPVPVAASSFICKEVKQDWVWFGDHVVSSISYTIVAPPGRKIEAGSGVFFRNKPRGSKQIFESQAKITAYGAGAMHIRVVDDRGPAKVCAATSELGAITILKMEF